MIPPSAIRHAAFGQMVRFSPKNGTDLPVLRTGALLGGHFAAIQPNPTLHYPRLFNT